MSHLVYIYEVWNVKYSRSTVFCTRKYEAIAVIKELLADHSLLYKKEDFVLYRHRNGVLIKGIGTSVEYDV